MGWYAHLADYEWNFTHNTNGMVEWVLGDAVAATEQPWWSKLGGHSVLGHGAWWDLLDGKTGEQATALLDGIVEGLSRQPERFREMNPPNGWGDRDARCVVRVSGGSVGDGRLMSAGSAGVTREAT